jgi:hypothetical protein
MAGSEEEAGDEDDNVLVLSETFDARGSTGLHTVQQNRTFSLLQPPPATSEGDGASSLMLVTVSRDSRPNATLSYVFYRAEESNLMTKVTMTTTATATTTTAERQQQQQQRSGKRSQDKDSVAKDKDSVAKASTTKTATKTRTKDESKASDSDDSAPPPPPPPFALALDDDWYLVEQP